ncbi:hypothetical protein CDAR_565851 [Caerostris darwini]|uniref:Uncharacterized protein n=1 Tax=Caerostris darwini TaxID=1538125 RepID=A0AAV4UYP7_9ARAC|nr:hypothetical protein CDAR_565851 [Caerostris darwini]
MQLGSVKRQKSHCPTPVSLHSWLPLPVQQRDDSNNLSKEIKSCLKGQQKSNQGTNEDRNKDSLVRKTVESMSKIAASRQAMSRGLQVETEQWPGNLSPDFFCLSAQAPRKSPTSPYFVICSPDLNSQQHMQSALATGALPVVVAAFRFRLRGL